MGNTTETTTTKENNAKANDFFMKDGIEVPVTYQGHKMTWHLRDVFTDELDEIDREYLAKTPDERKAIEHQHQVKLLTKLCTRAPENPLPGFPALDGENWEKAIYDFLTEFRNPGDEKRKKNLVSAITTLYYREVQPAEFFRGV